MLLTFDDMLKEAARTGCSYRCDYGTYDPKGGRLFQVAPGATALELKHVIDIQEPCWECAARKIDVEDLMEILGTNEFTLTYDGDPILSVAVKEGTYCYYNLAEEEDENLDSEDESEDVDDDYESSDSDDEDDEDDTCSGCCDQCHCHCHDDSDEEDAEYDDDDDDPDNENVISINYNGTDVDISLAALDHILTRILEYFDSED